MRDLMGSPSTDDKKSDEWLNTFNQVSVNENDADK